MHAPVVQQCVDDESVGVEAVPVAERLQRRGDRRIAPSRKARHSGEAATTTRNDVPARICVRQISVPRVPGAVKVFGQDSGLCWKKRAAIMP